MSNKTEDIMTNEQSTRTAILERLDELDMLQSLTDDEKLLKIIAERKKALRSLLNKNLNA